jgi:hypothetical protein
MISIPFSRWNESVWLRLRCYGGMVDNQLIISFGI